jgi:hypothetical protein
VQSSRETGTAITIGSRRRSPGPRNLFVFIKPPQRWGPGGSSSGRPAPGPAGVRYRFRPVPAAVTATVVRRRPASCRRVRMRVFVYIELVDRRGPGLDYRHMVVILSRSGNRTGRQFRRQFVTAILLFFLRSLFLTNHIQYILATVRRSAGRIIAYTPSRIFSPRSIEPLDASLSDSTECIYFVYVRFSCISAVARRSGGSAGGRRVGVATVRGRHRVAAGVTAAGLRSRHVRARRRQQGRHSPS